MNPLKVNQFVKFNGINAQIIGIADDTHVQITYYDMAAGGVMHRVVRNDVLEVVD